MLDKVLKHGKLYSWRKVLMKIIGRKKEIDGLSRLVESKKPEFVCVYGRRRVGKTYLIKQFFNDRFSFYISGIKGLNNRSQLSNFKKQLVKYGSNDKGIVKSWFDAFDLLIKLLEQENVYRYNNKRVVFIDEAPWMDAPKSDFKAGLDYFWNSWGNSQDDLILIICGSATSWIINNLLSDTGGFYNRLTKRIKLKPFDIKETKELLEYNNLKFSNREIVETYMIFGGIPYYINLLDYRLSLSQNIDVLFFNENGDLAFEKDLLLSSLFRNHEKHQMVLEALYNKKSGLTKEDISSITKMNSDRILKTVLDELEQCGFVRSFTDYKTRKNNKLYQIIDPFILFSYDVLNKNINSWLSYIATPSYYSWAGHAFETFCLNHIDMIKESLGINGLVTDEYSFTGKGDNKGTQIDLLIDRKDNAINLCEMKFSNDKYEIDKEYENKLINKREVFSKISGRRKNIILTFITLNGLINNSHSHIIQQSIVVNDWLDD